MVLSNVMYTKPNKAMYGKKAGGLTNVALNERSFVKYPATYDFYAIQHH
jgi:hypothetical protein